MRYCAKIQYIGKNYAGSQKQPDEPTIQGELEKAISTLINTNIKTVFSGRTDAGVNAIGQVFHMDTVQPILISPANIGANDEKKEDIVASNFLDSLNEILPDDISVSDLKEVPASFHAQKSAKSKHYQYELLNEESETNKNAKFLFASERIQNVEDITGADVDLERMQTALNYIKGEHDFTSFKNAGTLNPSKVCFIEHAAISKNGDKVVVDIIGNRFLYKMIRTIVGTLLEIERRKLPPEHMKSVLEAKDRTKAGKTVSPYGLTLIKVIY